MDVRRNLADMVTGTAPRTAPGMPARGDDIEIDGVLCTVTKSVDLGPVIKVWAFGKQDRLPRETTIRK